MSLVIPYFIPHQGSPHHCLFCNQQKITGEQSELDSVTLLQQDIQQTIITWLGYRRGITRTQFAFYGGSFTCLPLVLQDGMLKAVQPWLLSGEVESIRLSTRPDCIDTEICGFLWNSGVRTVELGVQSLDDKVLSTAMRGHNAEDCITAAECLKEHEFCLGIQLMPGLPGESRFSFIGTVRESFGLHPDFVRIYPALVIEHSGLAHLYDTGDFKPMTLERAIVMTAWARRKFLQSGIEVVRMGLQPSDSLEKSIIAGPYHPAFGELVKSREWFKKVKGLLNAHPHRNITITVSDRDISTLKGIRKENMTKLANLGLAERLQIKIDRTIERGKLRYVVS